MTASFVALLSLFQATLVVDTPVRVVLLKEMGSGLSHVGEEIPFVVADDVKDAEGRVLIEAGTLATAKVVQARREGALSASVLDRPARLAVDFQRTWAADLQPVPLKVVPGKTATRLQLNRDNTKIPKKESSALTAALETPGTREIVEGLAGMLEGKSMDDALLDPVKRKAVVQLSESLSLRNCYELIQKGKLGQLATLAARLRGGTAMDFPTIIDGTFSAFAQTMRAMREIASLSQSTLGYVGDRFKGRNINAPVGLELTVYVARPVQVNLPEKGG